MKFIILTSLFVIANCGRPKAKQQTHPRLSYDASRSLVEGQINKTFQGSILVWDDTVSPKDLSEVVRTSDVYLTVAVDNLKYLRDSVLPLRPALLSRIDAFSKIKEKASNETYDVSFKAAQNWILSKDGSSGLLIEKAASAGFDQEKVDAISKDFEAYCEAKLWERSVKLIEEKYTKRPHPAVVCDHFYKREGLVQENVAACEPSRRARSYFSCLWHEGVLKSPSWKKRYPTLDMTQTTDSELKEYFKKRRNYTKLLKADKLRLQSGTIDLSFTEEDNSSFTTATHNHIITQVENPVSRYAFIDGSLKSDLSEVLKLKTGYYVNENQYNLPFQADSEGKDKIRLTDVKKEELMQKFPKLFRLTSSYDLKIEALASELKSLSLEAAAKLRVVDGAQKNCLEEKYLEDRYCKQQRAQFESLAAATKIGVSQALFQSELVVREDEQTFISEFKVNRLIPNAPLLTVCMNEYASCLSEKFKGSYTDGILGIALGFSGLEKAFQPVPRSMAKTSATYNELGDLSAYLMDLKLSYNRIDSVLDTMVGSGKLIGEAKTYTVSSKLIELLPKVQKEVLEFRRELESL